MTVNLVLELKKNKIQLNAEKQQQGKGGEEEGGGVGSLLYWKVETKPPCVVWKLCQL